jgi:ribosomal protein L37AE/L43A
MRKIWKQHETSEGLSKLAKRHGRKYTRVTHRQIIEKTDKSDCPFCDLHLTMNHILWQCSETRNERDECGIQSTAWKESREGINKLVRDIRKFGFFHEI